MRARLLGMAVALVSVANMTSPALAQTGLVGNWKLNEGSGRAVADSSGFGNNGTLNGAVGWISGAFGSALSFDGTSGYVQVPDNVSLEPSVAITVSAWIRRSGSPGSFRYVLAKGAAGCSAASYGLYTGPTGGFQFYVSRNQGSVYARSPDAGRGVWDGKWHLVVGTFDGTTIRLYLDGVEVGSGTTYPGPLEYPLATSNDLFIGNYPGCPSEDYAFLGDVDDVAVWNQPLTSDAIKLMAHGEQTPATSAGSSGQGKAGGSGSSTQTTRGSAGLLARRPGSGGSAGVAPSISSLRMSPSRFSVAGGQTATGRSGALISYTDTEAARSTFRVLLRMRGSRRGRRCVAPAPRRYAKSGTSCFRYVVVAKFTRANRAGRNQFRFSGKVGRLRLRPGLYLLEAAPSLRGQAGTTASVKFQVIG